MNLDQMLESRLSQYRQAGCLQVVSRQPRPSARECARQRRVNEAVEARLAYLQQLEKSYSYEWVESVPAPLSLRSGVDYSLEEQADHLLADGRRGENRMSDTHDWLTKEQMTLRRQKEVYNSNGIPDGRLVCGMYRRVFNPMLGVRPTKTNKKNEE